MWLFNLSANGIQLDQWTQVANLVGNNIVYNSISQNIRNIYSVVTKDNDQVDLVFADGIYGNLPQGSFRVYYRTSNGLSYTISPNEMRGINITIPYINKRGEEHNITVGLALQYTVATSAPAEGIDTIRTNAPASFYTQNRMITGEDYNLAPLTSSQNILKVKSVNRTSSGISRNFDIIDATGRYSSVNVYANDGYIYKEETEKVLTFKYTNRIDAINFIRRTLETQFASNDTFNFYLTKYDKILFTAGETIQWNTVTSDVSQSTGYFKNGTFLSKVGNYATNSLKYITAGSLVKLSPPTGYAFKKNKIVARDSNDSDQINYIWAKVIKVVGDGTNAGRGTLANGLGPITLSENIPMDVANDRYATITRVVPKFVNDLSTAIETEMVNQISQDLNFGLRYSVTEQTWKIITSTNLDLLSDFSLGKSGDTSNAALDSSWIMAFVKNADRYDIRIRGLNYIFGSIKQNRFYFDANEKDYNNQLGKVVKDTVSVLGINTSKDRITPMISDISFEIADTIKFDDGYESTQEIKLAFTDSDDDNAIDNPDAFEDIVGEDSQLSYIFFQEVVDDNGYVIRTLIDNSNDTILVYQKESLINVNEFTDGQLIYFYDVNENRVKRVNRTTNTLDIENSYKGVLGRDNLKFQYVHNASINRRIDPSASNIVDVYLLTRSYNTEFRNYLAGAADKPVAPNSDSLKISFGAKLDAIKSISDEIIYHPVEYKVLFGSKADEKLQASFKVVKNPSKSINDNDLKVRIINAINEFFDVNNWDFGDKFYLSEMITYVINSVSPDVSNMVILPRQPSQEFGSLFEIQSKSSEIFVSGATVDDIEIVSAITSAEVRASVNSIVSST